MKNKNWQRTLEISEKENIVCKADFDFEFAGKTICSFLNTSGGFLVFGISENGDIVGLEKEKNLQTIETDISGKISPIALVSFETQEHEGKTFLRVEVPAGKDVPYSFDHDIFIRSRNQPQKADVETIRDMIMRRQDEPERWERRFSTADIETDLDYEEIKRVADSIHNAKRFQFRQLTEIELLEDVSVLKYGRLTNAGDVLFAKNPGQRYPQTRVKAVCFATDKTGKEYTDMQEIEGPLLKTLEETYKFIQRNTALKVTFDKKNMKREDKPTYPPNALREGLVNAFVHRDYAHFSGNVTVSIYPDRLEILNSGDFPKGVTPRTMTEGHISILRNPDIANIVYLAGMMEKLGRGGMLITKAFQEQNLKAPQWKNESGSVVLTFYAAQVKDTQYESSTSSVREPVPVQYESSTSAVPVQYESSTSPVPVENESLEKIILKLLQNNELSTSIISKLIGQSRVSGQLKVVLRELLDTEMVEMTIPDKPTSSKQTYRLTRKGKKVSGKSK
ncbi:MAG: RNA-binding domain-containing protein [Leptospirales bacterium]